MHIWWFPKFLVVFSCVDSLKKPCLHARTRPPAVTIAILAQTPSLGIDIPGYTFGSTIQARAIPPPSGAVLFWWIHVANRVSNGQLHLQLNKKALNLLLMIRFSYYGKKVWYSTKLTEFVSSSAAYNWIIHCRNKISRASILFHTRNTYKHYFL